MSVLLLDSDKFIDSNKEDQLAQKFEDTLSVKTFTLSSNTAFDDSSDRQDKEDSEKKNKVYKMPSKINAAFPKNNVVKSVTKSDSESSLDPWFHQIEGEQGFSDECTDSDEACQSDDDWNQIVIQQGANNIGESDSITEGPSQYREPRRRRKQKRMTVDPPIASMPEPTNIQKYKRFRNIKMQKESKWLVEGISKLSSSQIAVAQDSSKESPMALTCGKRKRVDERSLDYNTFAQSKLALKKSIAYLKNLRSIENDSDEVTSSESECALSTNDESREADDEQSDFFFDPETSKRIVNSDVKNDCIEKEKNKRSSCEEKLCQLLERTRIPNVPAFHAIAERAYQRRKEEIRQHLENLKDGKCTGDCSKLLKDLQPRSEHDDSRDFITAQRRLASIIDTLTAKDEFMTEDSNKYE